MLKLFTLCIENIKKQTDYYMVKKKTAKQNNIIIWRATSGTPCIQFIGSRGLITCVIYGIKNVLSFSILKN